MGFDLVFSGVIFCFFKFHLKLVFTNSTTIESLEKEQKNENLKHLKALMNGLNNFLARPIGKIVACLKR